MSDRAYRPTSPRQFDPTRPPDLVAGELILHQDLGLLVVQFLDDEEMRWGCSRSSSPTVPGQPEVYLYPSPAPPDWPGPWPPEGGALASGVLLCWKPAWRRMGR